MEMVEQSPFSPPEVQKPHLLDEGSSTYKKLPIVEGDPNYFSVDSRFPGGYANIAEFYGDFHLPTERKRAGSTAYHEAQHLLVARFGFDFQVIGVSRLRQGNSRGRTIFAGDLRHNPHGFMVTAAAGAVNHIGGKAEGFGSIFNHGSDIYVADSLSSTAKISIEEAMRQAESILEKIPERARQTVADLIETKGEIFGMDQINRVIDIALFEAEYEIDATYIENSTPEVVLTPYQKSIKEGSYTTIEDTENGQEFKFGVFNDALENQSCSLCQGKNGHRESCFMNH